MGSPLLLILDDFERVTAEARPTVGLWLSRAQEARARVTSRERLKLPGEVLFELSPPAVVGAPGATSAIPDGARVRLEGERGELTILG